MELDLWTQSLVAAMTALWTKVANFIPNLFGALVVVLLGFVVAKLLDTLLSKLLAKLGLDRLMAGTGLTKAGIRAVDVQAPLGTSLEFNYVATPGIVDLVNLSGAFLPFHKTETARIAAGDTRPSLESLYVNQAGYVAAVTTAANSLVSQRFLLQRDADRRVQRAQANPGAALTLQGQRPAA